MYEYLALLPIILPIIGALLTYVLGRYSEKIQDVFIVAGAALLFVLNASYLVALQRGILSPYSYGFIVLDAPGIFIGTLVAFIGTLVVFYSFVYKDRTHYDNTYFIMYFLLMGMMSGLASTYNVIVMLIFLEAATVISAVLILFGRTKRAINATYVYLAISIIEVILVVSGAFILYNDAGTLDLNKLAAGAISQNDMFLLAMLFFFGFGTKAGLLPLGIIWLPSAHSEAPPPISATMSGILIKASVVAMAKAIYPFYAISGVQTLILVVAGFGVANMLVGVIMALLSEDIKRLLAFHSISQMGYIIMGFGLATPAAVYGALFHITNHMLFKGCLFLITGALILRVNTRQIHKMGGLMKQMPLTGLCFLIASLAMSGVPLLNGFWSKEAIYEGSVQAGFPVLFSAFGTDFTAFSIIGWATSLLTFICLIHAFYVMFLGRPKDEFNGVRDPPVYMMLPILIMAGLCIVIGVYPGLVSGALKFVADTLLTLMHV
ncbi:MAG TPA: proton-conducting transporter membrane subunit [Methanocella sp.]|uniref:complex I subunit 5 family protein n=1 Tax=Methanocella sp. TaxID=2052833 RepID=UPI002CA16F5E|nr:proton-conducting transporter membrane subunit [Methanocella sp.]HTY91634.1 proton-conducting transporter membrane subunit [Methanocella sp.]